MPPKDSKARKTKRGGGKAAAADDADELRPRVEDDEDVKDDSDVEAAGGAGGKDDDGAWLFWCGVLRPSHGAIRAKPSYFEGNHHELCENPAVEAIITNLKTADVFNEASGVGSSKVRVRCAFPWNCAAHLTIPSFCNIAGTYSRPQAKRSQLHYHHSGAIFGWWSCSPPVSPDWWRAPSSRRRGWRKTLI